MKSFITVPIVYAGRIVGVLGVANRRLTHFTPQDAELLSDFACQAGVALENARLYELRERTVMMLAEQVDELNDERMLLKHSIACGDNFAELLLDGKTADDVASALSKLIGNPVAIRNCQDVPASSRSVAAPEGGMVPEGVKGQAVWPTLNEPERSTLSASAWRRHDHVLRVLADGQHGVKQVVAPIRSRNDLLGYLTVTEANRPLQEGDLLAIEQAAKAVGLDLVKQKHAFEVECRLRGDFVLDLVDGNYGDDEAILRRAAHLGFDLTKASRVMVVAIDDEAGGAGETPTADLRKRLFGVVCSAAIAQAGGNTLTSDDRHVIALCHCSEPAGRADPGGGAALDLANQIKRQMAQAIPGQTVSIGIGRVCRQAKEYRLSHREAIRALSLLSSAGQRDKVAFFEQMGAQCLLYEAHETGRLASFVDDTLGVLLEEDRRHGSRLVMTLARHLENNCNLSKTARDLFLHVNTLRYRLQRCEDIAHFDLEDPDTRFNLQLALRLSRVAGRTQF